MSRIDPQLESTDTCRSPTLSRLCRRADLLVVVTGRNAKPEMIEVVDCLTEFGLTKRPFAAGVRAQEAVEF
jgi:ATP:corrinoid adenosyltransferase